MSTDKARRGRPKGSGLDDRSHLDAIRRLMAQDPSLKPTTAIKMLGITDPSAIRRLRDKFKGADAAEGSEPQIRSTEPRETLEPVTALAQSLVSASMQGEPGGTSTAVLERAPMQAASPAPNGNGAQRALRLVASKIPSIESPPQRPEPRESAAPDVKPAAPSHQAGTHEAGHGHASTARGPEPESSADARSSAQAPPSSSPRPQSQNDEAALLLVRWYAWGVTAFLSTAEAQVKVMESVLKVPPVAFAVKQQLLFCELAKTFLPGGGKQPKRRG